MAKYLTWEPKAQRWVFQMRIPAAIRHIYQNRSTLRQHLGNLPQAQAEELAGQLAASRRAEFDRLVVTEEKQQAPDQPVKPVEKLHLDAEISRRFITTWQHREHARLAETLLGLAEAPDEVWQATIACHQAELPPMRAAVRRNLSEACDGARAEMEASLGFRLLGSEEALRDLCRNWNAARLAFHQQAIAALEGEYGDARLRPEDEAQLPLVELWGRPASAVVDDWVARYRRTGIEPNPKTLDKYRSIVADLGATIGRRPVEVLRHVDLQALVQEWAEDGNQVGTIRGKLNVLQDLLRPALGGDRLREIFDYLVPHRAGMRAKRLPFTDEQLRRYLTVILGDATLAVDDQALLLLMLLSAARLEELCQLTADAVVFSDGYWYLRFDDSRLSGQGESRLKNAPSARCVPIDVSVFAGLDEWLRTRVRQGGRLFPDLTQNKFGQWSGAVSKRLNRRLRQWVSKDRRLVLESTRNTAARALRREKVDPRLRVRYLGHADVGIHDQHYDPADLIDGPDLMDAAQSIARYLTRALQGESLPRLGQAGNGHTGRLELAREVLQVCRDPMAEQEATFDFQQGQSEFCTAPDLFCSPAQVALHTLGTVVAGGAPDLNVAVAVPGQQEVAPAVVVAPLREVEGVLGLGHKGDTVVLQHPGDGKFREGLAYPAGCGEPLHRSPRTEAFHGVDESMLARGVSRVAVHLAPALEVPHIPAAGDVVVEVDRVVLMQVVDAQPGSHGLEATVPAQVLTPGLLGPPHVGDSLDSVGREASREVFVAHMSQCAVCQPRQPVEGLGYFALDAMGQSHAVRVMGCPGPLSERRDAQVSHHPAPVGQGPAAIIGSSDTHGHPLSRKREGRAPGSVFSPPHPPGEPVASRRSRGPP